jgi:chitinase
MKRYFYVSLLILTGLFLVSCFNKEETIDTTYKITYIVDGEEVPLTPSSYDFTNETFLPDYTKTNYLLAGWYLDADFNEPIEKIAIATQGDIIVYGKLLPAHKLTLVSLNSTDVIFFHEEKEVTLPTDVAKEGYEFLGWYNDPEFAGEPFTHITKGTNCNITLYAKELKLYKLTLDFNGGNLISYDEYFNEEDEVILPTNIEKDNCEFIGWYLNDEEVTTIPTGTKSNITLIARYNEPIHTLTLDFKGGSEVTYNNEIKYSEEILLPTNIEKEHYEFIGWYKEEFYPLERVYKIEKYTNSDVTLYAHYDLSMSLFNHVVMPSEETLITNNLTLNHYILDETFYVQYESTDNIIDNDGILKRPYHEQELTITVKITDYQREICKDYTYLVAGYKSLDAPIRSGYIYRDYFKVNDYYFQNQEILYAAFALADADGNFTETLNPAYFGRVKSYLMPKAKELGVYVIMSVGPSAEWREFSKTAEKRENFANNIIELINQNGFDGVDIDWETPRAWAGEDVYYTELMKIVHQKVKANNPNHLVTTAISGGSYQGPNYNLRNSGKYIDYINLMTYHMAANGGLYQSALYPRSSYHNSTFKVGMPGTNSTVSDTINIFNNNYQVPSSKLIVGVPFYGIKQTRTNTSSSFTYFGSLLYEDILKFELTKPNQRRYFDEISKVPYIINDEGTIFIAYEDSESIRLKAEFVIEKGVAGMMYWEYYHEYENILLTAMVENLPKNS